MSILLVGISHRSAPVSILERLALDSDGATKLLIDALAADHVAEAAVIATCNRLEVYAAVDRFHGSVEEISRLLLDRCGLTAEELVPHLYVHYDDGAVAHLFNVAAGLDSMVLGESQILGQTRESLRIAQEHGGAGPTLNQLFQQALRVGKRVRAETGIDRAAPSLVGAALDRIAGPAGLTGRTVLVVGAGSMATLAVATVTARGAGAVTVLNRTRAHADRLARQYGARAGTLAELPAALAAAQIVVTCAGATEVLLSADAVGEALRGDQRELALVDLALPHDIDPEAGALPGVTLVNLAQLADELHEDSGAHDLTAARQILADEITSFGQARQQARVTPTLVALRTMATTVVETEMARLDARLPQLDDRTRAEVQAALRRVSDKLLHRPTVRVKQLSSGPAMSYATALAELFALDPDAVDAVTRAEVE